MVGFFFLSQKTQKITDAKGSNRSHSILRSPLEETSLPIRTKLIHDHPAKAPINIWNRGPFVKRHQQFPNSTSLIGVFLRLRQSVIGCCAKLSHPTCQSSPSVSINLHFPPLLGKHPFRFLPPKITYYYFLIGDTTSRYIFIHGCFSILSCWFSGGG